MRNAFFRTLLDLADHDERITLVVGDLGFAAVEPFVERHPLRFVNVGVAEQNLIGIAAGLALSGKVVFAYSIGNFPVMRCLEQIRNDVCYHNAEVKIVTTGGGFAYGSLGFSHHVTEDLAVMRALPNMTVVAPGDPVEVERATRQIARRPGPCYLRLGRVGEPVVHPPDVDFELGKAITVRGGRDLALIAIGGMLPTAVQVADRLSDDGIEARVLSMHTLKPIDAEAVRAAARETASIVTIEEHVDVGGLGSAVAEVLAESADLRAPLQRIAIPSTFSSVAGTQQFLRARVGLSVEGIIAAIRPLLAHAAALKARPSPVLE